MLNHLDEEKQKFWENLSWNNLLRLVHAPEQVPEPEPNRKQNLLSFFFQVKSQQNVVGSEEKWLGQRK